MTAACSISPNGAEQRIAAGEVTSGATQRVREGAGAGAGHQRSAQTDAVGGGVGDDTEVGDGPVLGEGGDGRNGVTVGGAEAEHDAVGR